MEKKGLHVVIGSGPAGVACAQALLKRGKRVHLLDGGVKLEPNLTESLEKLKNRKPAEWTSDELSSYQRGMKASAKGVPLKLVYGSDFAYRQTEEHLGVKYSNSGVRPSLATGGLSNVWGAAMLP